MIGDDWQRDVLGARLSEIDANLVAPETRHSAASRGCGEAGGIAVTNLFVDPPPALAMGERGYVAG
jgi:hypothetical protein